MVQHGKYKSNMADTAKIVIKASRYDEKLMTGVGWF